MEDEMLEAIEWINGKMYDDYDPICGEEHEINMKLNICLFPLKKIP